ncbi:hypothetical protein MY11210_009370 [Beauveria gryllotalpidicola]
MRSWRTRITPYVRIRGNPQSKTLLCPAEPEQTDTARADITGVNSRQRLADTARAAPQPAEEGTNPLGPDPGRQEGADFFAQLTGLLSPLTLTSSDSTSTSSAAGASRQPIGSFPTEPTTQITPLVPPPGSPVASLRSLVASPGSPVVPPTSPVAPPGHPVPPADTDMASQPTSTGLSPEAIQHITQIVQAAIAQHSRQHSGSQSPPPDRHPDEDGHLNTNRLRKNDRATDAPRCHGGRHTPFQPVMALCDRWGTIRDLARQTYNRREDRRGPSRHPNRDWQRSRPFATQGRSQRFSGPGYNKINNNSSNTPPPAYQPLRDLPQGPAPPPSAPFYGNSGIPNAKPTYDSGQNAFQKNNGYNNHNNNYNSNRYSSNNRFSSQANRPQAQIARIHHQDGEHIIEPGIGTEEPIDDWSEELCQHPDEMYSPDDYFREVEVDATISPAEELAIQDRDVHFLATASQSRHSRRRSTPPASYNTQNSVYQPVLREQKQILADTAQEVHHVTSSPSASLSLQDVSPRPKTPLPIITAADRTEDLRPPAGVNWTYLRFWVCPDPEQPGIVHDVCADTGVAATLADETWLARHYPNLAVLRKPEPIHLKASAPSTTWRQSTSAFPSTRPGTQVDGTPAIANKVIDATLVDDLKANMLLGIDTLGPLEADILISQRRAVIQECNAMVAQKDTMIEPGHMALVPVHHHKAVHGVRYIFEPRSRPDATMFAAMMEADTDHVLFRNDSDKRIQIPKLKPGWEETLTQRPQGPNERKVIETTTQDLLDKGKLLRRRSLAQRATLRHDRGNPPRTEDETIVRGPGPESGGGRTADAGTAKGRHGRDAQRQRDGGRIAAQAGGEAGTRGIGRTQHADHADPRRDSELRGA